MNKLSVQATAFQNPSASKSDSSTAMVHAERSRRLIVLIPPEMQCSNLTRRICKLADEFDSDIQLLGLYRNSTQELELQRELITASALIRDARIYVEMSIEMGTDWLAAVKRIYQDGDTIVCIADETVGIQRKPLSQILESTFKAPIYILTEAKPNQSSSGVLSQLLAWSGLIGIVIVFFLLEAQVVRLPDNWFKTVLSIVLLIPELLSIMFWNSLF